MGIMDIFRGAQPKPAEPGSPNLNGPTVVGSPNNPNLPVGTPEGNNPAATTAQEPASPMASFDKLWENDPTKKPAVPAPLFDIDPAKLNEAISQADFARTIPPEIVQKALAGDPAAFAEAMNSVARTAFSHQTMATTKLIDQALQRRDKELEARVPGMIRNASIAENLADMPIFTHEATKPLMDSLQAQLAAKYPQASAAQIAEQARTYIANFAKMAS